MEKNLKNTTTNKNQKDNKCFIEWVDIKEK